MLNQRKGGYLHVLFLGLLALITGQNAIAQDGRTINVDCAKSRTGVQGAVDKVRGASSSTIEIRGTCTEVVTVAKDDLTLRAHADGGTIVGSVNVLGGQRVTIDGLKVTGGGEGVLAADNASVHVNNAELTQNAGSGVLATRGAIVNLRGNTIGENGEYGVLVVDGANAQIRGGNVIESGVDDFFIGAAVGGFRHATIRIRDGDNIIRNTARGTPGNPQDSSSAPGYAIDVEHLSILRQDAGHAVIDGHISIFNLTSADFRDAEITGHIFIDGLNPNFRLRNSTVTGGMNIAGFADIRNDVTFTGDIYCNFNFLNPNFAHNGDRIDCFP